MRCGRFEGEWMDYQPHGFGVSGTPRPSPTRASLPQPGGIDVSGTLRCMAGIGPVLLMTGPVIPLMTCPC